MIVSTVGTKKTESVTYVLIVNYDSDPLFGRY